MRLLLIGDTVISSKLIQQLRHHFVLDWDGIHGAPHWARVRENGIRLAAATGANVRVVETFAFIHDSCRQDDWQDPDHGSRAAVFARSLTGTILDLSQDEMDLLATACEGHSRGLMVGDPTLLTCWDADRLDLGRVGIRPDPNRLGTEAARRPDFLQWAYARSLRSRG